MSQAPPVHIDPQALPEQSRRTKPRLPGLPFTTLDRYVMRSIISSYLIFLAIMLSLYVVIDLFANFDEFAEEADGFFDVFRRIANYYRYTLFLYFAHIAGLITVVAAAITLAWLQKNRELVATLAGGVSMRRMLFPVVLVAVILNVLWAVDQEIVIPRIADKLVRTHEESTGVRPFEIYFLRDHDDALLSTTYFDPAEQTMYDFNVMQRDPETKQVVGMITADLATWDEKAQAWNLRRGKRIRRTGSDAGFRVVREMESEEIETYRSAWLPRDLLLRQSAAWTSLLSLRQINDLMEKRDLIPNVQELVAAKHVRFTQPIANMLLVFLGVPLFLNRQGRNVLMAVGLSMVLCLLCFVATFVCHTLAGTATNSALVAWLPIMIFTPVAALMVDSIKT